MSSPTLVKCLSFLKKILEYCYATCSYSIFKYTHGKKLENTSVNARVNLSLKLSYILKMFYQTFSINQDLFYPRLRLRGNDKGSAIPAVDSAHLDTENYFLILGPCWHLLRYFFFHKV